MKTSPYTFRAICAMLAWAALVSIGNAQPAKSASRVRSLAVGGLLK